MPSSCSRRLDVFFQRFAAGAGACAADGVGGHDDGSVGRGGGDVVVVAADGVEHGLLRLAILLGLKSMPMAGWPPSTSWSIALPMSWRIAASPGEIAVEAQFVGDHLAEVGHFDGVAQDVLAVAGAVVESAHHAR